MLREIPRGDTGVPTEYAGKDAEYEKGSVMFTDEGRKVTVVDYLKDKGLYVVGNFDAAAGSISPLYRISPDKLQKIEDKDREE